MKRSASGFVRPVLITMALVLTAGVLSGWLSGGSMRKYMQNRRRRNYPQKRMFKVNPPYWTAGKAG